LAFVGGLIKFHNSVTGQAATRNVKLLDQGDKANAGAPIVLAHLGPRRVIAVRNASGADVEVFIFRYDEEHERCDLDRDCTLSFADPMPTIAGPLCGASVIDATQGHERLLLCWPTAGASSSLVWAAAELPEEGAEAVPLRPLSAGSASAAAVTAWACVGGFLVEFTAPSASEPWPFTLRDARLGMPVASGELPSVGRPGRRATHVASDPFGSVTALASGKEGLVAGLRWSLPSFGLQMLIGSKRKQSDCDGNALQPLQEVLSAKRKRKDDTGVAALFDKSSASRRAASEKALVAELKSRSWRPTHDLLDIMIQHECWAAARQLLALPELDEDLAVRLAVARPGLLPAVVHQTFGSRRLGASLRQWVPAAHLSGMMEALLQMLEAYREYTETELAERLPGFPRAAEVVSFLRALADGCLMLLTGSVSAELLERVHEALAFASHDAHRVENLYAAVSACCNVKKPPRLAPEMRPVEVYLLPI